MEAVQEGEGVQRGVCSCDWGERCVRDAVGRVDEAFGCFGGGAVRQVFCAVAVDAEGRQPFSGRCVGEKRVGCKGEEECRVEVERVVCGREPRDAEPGRQRRETVVVPVGVVGECGCGCYGAEMVP